MNILVSANPFKPVWEIYDDAIDAPIEGRMRIINQVNLLSPFESLKTSIYCWKSKEVTAGGLINREIFDFNFFKFSNQRNFLLYTEFHDDKTVILGDADYIRTFTEAIFFSNVLDGTHKSYLTPFIQIYIIYGFIADKLFP